MKWYFMSKFTIIHQKSIELGQKLQDKKILHFILPKAACNM